MDLYFSFCYTLWFRHHNWLHFPINISTASFSQLSSSRCWNPSYHSCCQLKYANGWQNYEGKHSYHILIERYLSTQLFNFLFSLIFLPYFTYIEMISVIPDIYIHRFFTVKVFYLFKQLLVFGNLHEKHDDSNLIVMKFVPGSFAHYGFQVINLEGVVNWLRLFFLCGPLVCKILEWLRNFLFLTCEIHI